MSRFKNICQIIVGAAIYSFALNYLTLPIKLYEGGVTGLTLIAYYLFGFPPAVVNILVNIPLFIFGWRILGKKSFYYSLIGTLSLSFWLAVFEKIPFQIDLGGDLMITVILIGALFGLGLGLVFNAGGTTGGSDILARLLNKYIHLPVGRLLLLVDACVLLLTLLVFKDLKMVLYTLIAVFISTQIIDLVSEGGYTGKGFMIISPKSHEIAQAIDKELERGVTYLKGQGFYSQQHFDIIYCILARNEIHEMKAIIHRIDPHAFITVTEATEVMGEGFTLDENKQPLKS